VEKMSKQHKDRELFAELRKTYLQELGQTCYICGQKKEFMEIHHKKPLGNGGTNLLDNCVLLCSDCHFRLHKKGNPVKRLETMRKYQEKERASFLAHYN
jgi:5-methylcytosine-specific restriction endonuclease McrA